MKKTNYFKLTIPAKSANEGFSRAVISAFTALCDPTVEELSDIKTAVSEAVTNCIVHAYKEKDGVIYIDAAAFDNGSIKIKIRDKGCGIADISQAREALYTTAGDERSGLGFTVMESFSDKLTVRSKLGSGTTVTITKTISGR